jgi:hypothetical protein
LPSPILRTLLESGLRKFFTALAKFISILLELAAGYPDFIINSVDSKDSNLA